MQVFGVGTALLTFLSALSLGWNPKREKAKSHFYEAATRAKNTPRKKARKAARRTKRSHRKAGETGKTAATRREKLQAQLDNTGNNRKGNYEKRFFEAEPTRDRKRRRTTTIPHVHMALPYC